MDKNSKLMSSSSAKVILNDNDFTLSTIQIPSALVKSYGDVLPSQATLKIDDSGKYWSVTIEKFKDQYFFTDGWEEFAQAVDLSSWDYLTFNSATSFQCQKTERDHIQEKDSGKNEESVPERQEDPYAGKKWSFTRELKKNKPYRLVLPKKFAANTGIATSKKITLTDANGRKWPVRVVGASCGEIALGSGWNAFLVANKVVVGSTLLFKFDSCSKMTMAVQVVKEGPDENALFDMNAKKAFDRES